MPVSFRLATYNVENLFSRAKILNFRDESIGDELLAKVDELKTELRKTNYTSAVKTSILNLFNELKAYIEINETRGRLFEGSGNNLKVGAKGSGDWSGFISFKRADLNESAIKNTAKAIRTVNADACCLVEAEDLPTIRHFLTDAVHTSSSFQKYRHQMLIDGNDPRGIDVGIVSRFPIGQLRSHMDEKEGNSEIFSRDCLEVELKLPNGKSLWMLLNHFKSKRGGNPPSARAKRKRQAQRVHDLLLQNYDLKNDLVVVAGDFNDTPDSDPLSPLLTTTHLHDALAVGLADPAERWTYIYENEGQQIDYLLISTPLKNALKQAGVMRRGIFGVDKFTNGSITPFPEVTSHANGASDHGAVFADFEI